MADRPRIFVQMASYRDSECQWTIKDLFDKAAYPERVFVGVCWQFDPEQDQHCFQIPSPYPDHVRRVDYRLEECRGVCWARYEAQKLWQGEEYVFMIDSHMRFVQHWDEVLLQELAECPSPKPILTNYPARYTPPNNLQQNPSTSVRTVKPFSGDSVRGNSITLLNKPERPLPGAFMAAGNLFASSKLIEEVPYDPYMNFNQEEITLSVRMWTHGWDFFTPKNVSVYHLYFRKENSDAKYFWEDQPQNWSENDKIAWARYKHLLGMEPTTNAQALVDFDQFSLGTVRSLAEYEAFSGVHFKDRHVSRQGIEAHYIENLDQYRPLTPQDVTLSYRKKLGIVVPYRNRERYLSLFLDYLPRYLKLEGIVNYVIIVAEQTDEKIFNAGTARNVGGLYAAETLNCDYLIFHDVDMLPESCLDYSYPAVDTIWFGNVGSFKIFSTSFKTCNGFNNSYVGYGSDNIEFWQRLDAFEISREYWHKQPYSKKARLYNLEADIKTPEEALVFSKKSYAYEKAGDGPQIVYFPGGRPQPYNRGDRWFNSQLVDDHNALCSMLKSLPKEAAKTYYGFYGLRQINPEKINVKSQDEKLVWLQFSRDDILY